MLPVSKIERRVDWNEIQSVMNRFKLYEPFHVLTKVDLIEIREKTFSVFPKESFMILRMAFVIKSSTIEFSLVCFLIVYSRTVN